MRRARLLNPSLWAFIGAVLVLAGPPLPWASYAPARCDAVVSSGCFPFIPGIFTSDGLFTVACGFAATVFAAVAVRQRDVRLPMLVGVLASVGPAGLFAVLDWLDSYGTMGPSIGIPSFYLISLAPGFYVVGFGIALAAAASLVGIIIGLLNSISLCKERRADRPGSA